MHDLPDIDLMAEIRMPSIMNFQFLPDMGIMDGGLVLDAGIGYSQARIRVLKLWHAP
jgi:hypothetical protein